MTDSRMLTQLYLYSCKRSRSLDLLGINFYHSDILYFCKKCTFIFNYKIILGNYIGDIV